MLGSGDLITGVMCVLVRGQWDWMVGSISANEMEAIADDRAWLLSL